LPQLTVLERYRSEHLLQQSLRILQWTSIAVGLVLVGVFVVAIAHQKLGSHSAIRDFEKAREAVQDGRLAEQASAPTPVAEPQPTRNLPDSLPVDTSLWAEGRIAEYEQSLTEDLGLPVGILRVPKIDLEVPVFTGTDDLTLNRGVGWIEGTAPVDASGNIGIAGHRDGFFRGLKDVVVGDSIELETLAGTREFVIDHISIVDPSNVSVLAPTERPTVTLVTCYPFYFVGHAPQRYIVRATLAEPGAA
jgi:LPXTG-site transpeptidase (sortase) family protein